MKKILSIFFIALLLASSSPYLSNAGTINSASDTVTSNILPNQH